MVLVMARPTKRKRIPADVLEKARGQRVTITFPSDEIGGPDLTTGVVLGNDVRFSLQTRDAAVAKARTGIATAQLERVFENIRKAPQPLSHKQRLALAGIVRQELINEWEENPGDPDSWDLLMDTSLDALGDLRRQTR